MSVCQCSRRRSGVWRHESQCCRHSPGAPRPRVTPPARKSKYVLLVFKRCPLLRPFPAPQLPHMSCPSREIVGTSTLATVLDRFVCPGFPQSLLRLLWTLWERTTELQLPGSLGDKMTFKPIFSCNVDRPDASSWPLSHTMVTPQPPPLLLLTNEVVRFPNVVIPNCYLQGFLSKI